MVQFGKIQSNTATNRFLSEPPALAGGTFCRGFYFVTSKERPLFRFVSFLMFHSFRLESGLVRPVGVTTTPAERPGPGRRQVIFLDG